MKKLTQRKRNHVVVAALSLVVLLASNASAKCGRSTNSPSKGAVPEAYRAILERAHAAAARPEIAPAIPQGPEPSIVGLWNNLLVVDGQLADAAFDQYYLDGNEVLNDQSPPASGNVCLGVWSRIAPYTYVLNHPSWIFDDSNTNVVAVIYIRQTMTLDKGGQSFTGKSIVDVFDLNGNLLDHEEADIVGSRITVVTDGVTNGVPGGATYNWPDSGSQSQRN